jgi:hypothetical protein
MLEKKIKQTRELLLNEIVATLEYLAYLKNQSKASLKFTILKFELKKVALITKLRAIELVTY